jgi:ribonuclease HII
MNRDEEEVIIGVDEAGRGACIGPLVIAAVKISKDKYQNFVNWE